MAMLVHAMPQGCGCDAYIMLTFPACYEIHNILMAPVFLFTMLFIHSARYCLVKRHLGQFLYVRTSVISKGCFPGTLFTPQSIYPGTINE